MNNLQKVWLCGIVTNQKDNILELVEPVYDFFDGLVFVDGGSTDGTKEVLEKYKKDGQIMTVEWSHNHGYQMQGILNSNKILNPDWVIYCDSMERISLDFASNIRGFISNLEQQNINTVYNYGKILMHMYFPDQVWKIITPHCWLENSRPNAVDLARIPQLSDESKTRYNVRPQKRPRDHFIDHFVKYSFVYAKLNNQMTCGREGNTQEIKEQEENRQNFVYYCARILKIDLTVEALKTYLLNNKLDDYVKSYLNYQPYFNQFYRYHVLGHTVDDIIKDNEQKKLFQII